MNNQQMNPDSLFSPCQLVIYSEWRVTGLECRLLYLLSGLNRFTWHRWQEKRVRDRLIFQITVALRLHIMRALFTCLLLHTNVLFNNSALHWNESAMTPVFSCQLSSEIAAVARTCSLSTEMSCWYLSVCLSLPCLSLQVLLCWDHYWSSVLTYQRDHLQVRAKICATSGSAVHTPYAYELLN